MIRQGIMPVGYVAIFIDEVEHNDFITPELLKYIIATVNNGSRQKIVEELGISTATLWRKMKKYGIAE